MIKLENTEMEINKRGIGNYLYILASVEDSGFKGWSNFVFSEVAWDEFIKNLKAFAKKLKGSAETYTGWGDEVYFRIKFEMKDKLGHIWITGEIGKSERSKISVNPPISHKLFYTYEIDVSTLDSFIKQCKSFKATGAIVEI